MSIAVIAGLGNPGLKYRNTRHNIGFMLVDQLAKRHGARWRREARHEAKLARCAIAGRQLLLAKPQACMNHSGRALGSILRYRGVPAAALLVIYDDLTLELGRSKLSLNGSAGGHNGIADLLQELGPGFARYRIGIGARPDKSMDLADYVLSRFRKEEAAIYHQQRSLYMEQLEQILTDGPEAAMNSINQRKATPKPSPHERND
jgi:PTH1 family peptidyl-tRNA hydrolase